MIVKMPPVAKEGLDQLHVMDRANRKQYFYLNLLEPYNSGRPLNVSFSNPDASTKDLRLDIRCDDVEAMQSLYMCS